MTLKLIKSDVPDLDVPAVDYRTAAVVPENMPALEPPEPRPSLVNGFARVCPACGDTPRAQGTTPRGPALAQACSGCDLHDDVRLHHSCDTCDHEWITLTVSPVATAPRRAGPAPKLSPDPRLVAIVWGGAAGAAIVLLMRLLGLP